MGFHFPVLTIDVITYPSAVFPCTAAAMVPMCIFTVWFGRRFSIDFLNFLEISITFPKVPSMTCCWRRKRRQRAVGILRRNTKRRDTIIIQMTRTAGSPKSTRYYHSVATHSLHSVNSLSQHNIVILSLSPDMVGAFDCMQTIKKATWMHNGLYSGIK